MMKVSKECVYTHVMCTLTHTLSYPVCTQLGINKQHIIQKVGPRVGVTGVLLVDTVHVFSK